MSELPSFTSHDTDIRVKEMDRYHTRTYQYRGEVNGLKHWVPLPYHLFGFFSLHSCKKIAVAINSE